MAAQQESGGVSDRFAGFTGWELQALARGLSDQPTQRSEQREAVDQLLDEVNDELDQREELGFTDPAAVRNG